MKVYLKTQFTPTLKILDTDEGQTLANKIFKPYVVITDDGDNIIYNTKPYVEGFQDLFPFVMIGGLVLFSFIILRR